MNVRIPRPLWWLIGFVLLFVVILVIHALGGFMLHISWFKMGVS